MNEKFFDLKREKQDRIINAAMKVFALCGYDHASTDEMVKEAHISKGLLFHYFGSKQGLYVFLYDYCVRFATLEINRNVGREETDYFRLQEQLLDAWADAMRQYPFIRLFLMGAETEEAKDVAEEISAKRKTFAQLLREVENRADAAAFREGVDVKRITAIVRYTIAGLLRDADKDREAWPERFLANARIHLDVLKSIAY